MRLDKDYLMEMELWPHFEMRGAGSVAPATTPTGPQSGRSSGGIFGDRASSVSTIAPASASPTSAPVNSISRNQPIKAATVPRQPTALAPADPVALAKIAAADWPALQAFANACRSCGLCGQRNNVVFGVGAATAQWLFIGEGPGAEEDETGEPFVGQAGKLLDAMLGAVGLTRGREVYIANVVKCRPPGNRTPLPEEALACAPLLDRQIDLIQPKIIVALGKTAITRLTGSEAAMAALRGRVHHYRNIPVIATYHPAYLLRNLPEKLKAWEDLQLAKTTLAGVL